MNEREYAFEDGNVTRAVRVGETVRRNSGPSSPAIHVLLRHLEAVGFAHAPRLLGLDERGREVLTYVAGETNPDPRISFGSEEAVESVARLLRRYHDAVAGVEPLPAAAWRFQVGAPTTGDVVCHNDVAPYNLIVDHGQPMTLIDWDFAAPAPRVWDIAHALWRFVPLYQKETFGSPTVQIRRARVFCDAYGLANRVGLVATVERRQRALYDSVAAWAAAGDPAFVALWHRGDAAAVLDDIAYLRRNRSAFERGLE